MTEKHAAAVSGPDRRRRLRIERHGGGIPGAAAGGGVNPKIRELIAGRPVLLDGAWGTELQARGLEPGVLTVTMTSMKKTIEALETAGVRGAVKRTPSEWSSS